MKNIFKKINIVVALSVASMVALSSCGDEEAPSFGTGAATTLANSESFIQVVTPVVSFQAGTASYDIQVNVIQGYDRITSLKLISVYNDAATATGLTSDPVEMAAYTVTAGTGERAVLEATLTYDDLRTGITIDGKPLSTSDYDLAIGASWSLTFEAVYADGTSGTLPGTIAVAVLSPYAGLYTVNESAYFRIGVESGASPWNGAVRFIGSVDETTFRHEYVGPLLAANFGEDPWTFSVNYDTYVITAPADKDQHLIGDEQRNCVDNASSFVNVPCAGSNVLIPDATTGAHEIRLTYGYFINDPDPGTGGTREFYEFMTKN